MCIILRQRERERGALCRTFSDNFIPTVVTYKVFYLSVISAFLCVKNMITILLLFQEVCLLISNIRGASNYGDEDCGAALNSIY